MNCYVLVLIALYTPFLAIKACALDSTVFGERTDRSLITSLQEKPEKPLFKVSGEVIFWTQQVGFRPHRSEYNTGCRIFLEKEDFFKYVALGVTYTFWETRGKKSYKIPIFLTTRTIETQSSWSDIQVFISHAHSMIENLKFQPLLGLEWTWKSNEMLLDEKFMVLTDYQYWGPLIGFSLGKDFKSYLSLKLRTSFSYLRMQSQRIVVKTVNLERESFSPKAHIFLGFEGVVPFNENGSSLRIGGGYEVQYLWSEGVDQRLDWKSPLTLQGFSAHISFNF